MWQLCELLYTCYLQSRVYATVGRPSVCPFVRLSTIGATAPWDPLDTSPPTPAIMGTKCIWSLRLFSRGCAYASVSSGHRTPMLRVCCCRRGGQDISINCCMHSRRSAVEHSNSGKKKFDSIRFSQPNRFFFRFDSIRQSDKFAACTLILK